MAVEGIKSTKTAFEELDIATPVDLREAWTNSENVAMIKRGENLKIYDIQLGKGMTWFCMRLQTQEFVWPLQYHLLQKQD